MIYDGFLFFNELELLELRLHELSDVVDRFILVEAPVTFTGIPKEMVFKNNRHRFEKFLDRIIHVEASDTPKTTNPWVREEHQRNCILRGLPYPLREADTLILADLDEIPRAETLRKILPVLKPVTLRMDSYGGYLNARSGNWEYTKVTPVKVFEAFTAEQLRKLLHHTVPDGGWHFSSVGSAQRIHTKLDAISHQEPSVQQWNNLERLERDLKAGIGVFGGKMTFEKIDERFPKYLLENIEKFKDMIWPL